MARILVVDDEPAVRAVVAEFLSAKYAVKEAESADEALDILEKARKPYDLIISDLNMPLKDGFELFKEVQELYPGQPVIFCTGDATVEKAVQAMQMGAYDYIIKPVVHDDLDNRVRNALERHNLIETNKVIVEDICGKDRFGGILGRSKEMKRVFSILSRAAAGESTILILGETGTGKEMVARAIREFSKRSKKAFVAVNCAAIAANLLESELFGHAKGAFTGADRAKKGLIEEANGGTLFLDEIGEMQLDLQTKFLRFLQEREIRPVGATSPVKVDVRIVAATNKDLAAEVKAGTFRADLFYRLNVIPISLPRLANRKGDIPLLTKYFLKVHRRDDGSGPRRISLAGLQVFERYQWPGNVRELENIIERAVQLNDEEELGADAFVDLKVNGDKIVLLPETAVNSLADNDDGSFRSLAQQETHYILRVLDWTEGNKSKASKILDIDYTTLLRKLKRI